MTNNTHNTILKKKEILLTHDNKYNKKTLYKPIK